MQYVIRFRYIPPYEYMTPLMHIPIESTRVEADTPGNAWATFIKGIPDKQKDWVRCEEIYLYT